MWRHTLAIAYVVAGKYWNAAVYHFGLTEFLPLLVRDEMLDRLIEAIELDLGYSVDTPFWFKVAPHESVDRAPYVKGETEDCIVTDVYLKKGRKELTVFNLEYARKMIAGGKWFKGETLEKWLPIVEVEHS